MIRAVVFDAYGTLYDVQSVATFIEASFPGRGSLITQVWRLKQLEYTWLRSMMGAYADFRTVTREAMAYTLETLGLDAPDDLLDEVAALYNRLTPYADAEQALKGLPGCRLAIMSNGSRDMLDALVAHSGFSGYFEAVISVVPIR